MTSVMTMVVSMSMVSMVHSLFHRSKSGSSRKSPAKSSSSMMSMMSVVMMSMVMVMSVVMVMMVILVTQCRSDHPASNGTRDPCGNGSCHTNTTLLLLLLLLSRWAWLLLNGRVIGSARGRGLLSRRGVIPLLIRSRTCGRRIVSGLPRGSTWIGIRTLRRWIVRLFAHFRSALLCLKFSTDDYYT